MFRQQCTRARETRRGVSIDASSTRFVREGGGSPCRLSQLTCSVFLFYFRRFLFCCATPHVPPPPPPIPGTEPALCFDHVTPPRSKDARWIVGSPPGYAAQLLIALPISARARSRTTPPAAGLQTNACPIINCHDPLIGGGGGGEGPRLYFSSAYLSRLLFLSTFSRRTKGYERGLIVFDPPFPPFVLVKINFFFLPKKEILPYLPLPISLSFLSFTLWQYLLFHGNLS